MEAILHIGMGKTGTSSIQKLLSDNYENLLDKKIFYSMFLNNSNNKKFFLGNEQLIDLNYKKLAIDKIKKVNKIIVENKINKFIWSLES